MENIKKENNLIGKSGLAYQIGFFKKKSDLGFCAKLFPFLGWTWLRWVREISRLTGSVLRFSISQQEITWPVEGILAQESFAW